MISYDHRTFLIDAIHFIAEMDNGVFKLLQLINGLN